MSDGWVRIYHPDQVPEPPDPDNPEDHAKFGLATREAYDLVWKPRGFVDLDQARSDVDPNVMPEKAADRIAWIDAHSDPGVRELRARAALEDEEARGDEARSTVVTHAEEVLTSTEDETTPTDTET